MSALEVGYRLLDTAVNYENEPEVGEALRRSGVPRDQVKVCSKLPGRHHGYDEAIRSTHESLERLGLARLDLHLIHWPNPSVDKYVEAWQALVDLQRDGLVTSIGVSNFTGEPTCNGSSTSPASPRRSTRSSCTPTSRSRRCGGRRGPRHPHRVVEPAGQATGAVHRARGRDAAERHGVEPAQVILRWQVQLGCLPIPKSATPERQRSNLDVFGFELTDEEMAAITGARPARRSAVRRRPRDPRGDVT